MKFEVIRWGAGVGRGQGAGGFGCWEGPRWLTAALMSAENTFNTRAQLGHTRTIWKSMVRKLRLLLPNAPFTWRLSSMEINYFHAVENMMGMVRMVSAGIMVAAGPSVRHVASTIWLYVFIYSILFMYPSRCTHWLRRFSEWAVIYDKTQQVFTTIHLTGL